MECMYTSAELKNESYEYFALISNWRVTYDMVLYSLWIILRPYPTQLKWSVFRETSRYSDVAEFDWS